MLLLAVPISSHTARLFFRCRFALAAHNTPLSLSLHPPWRLLFRTIRSGTVSGASAAGHGGGGTGGSVHSEAAESPSGPIRRYTSSSSHRSVRCACVHAVHPLLQTACSRASYVAGAAAPSDGSTAGERLEREGNAHRAPLFEWVLPFLVAL